MQRFFNGVTNNTIVCSVAYRPSREKVPVARLPACSICLPEKKKAFNSVTAVLCAVREYRRIYVSASFCSNRWSFIKCRIPASVV